MFAAYLVALVAAHTLPARARDLSSLQQRLLSLDENNVKHPLNVSSCPGYSLSSVEQTRTGLTARLALAGPACNAFGNDYADLALEVTYESKTRLHVALLDAADSQFRIPASVIARPAAAALVDAAESELVFNYTARPFAFWISRRDDPAGTPLFDTRASSLPVTPIPPVIEADASTALDGFPLVFEDQYLQLTSALPRGANVYGLGEVLASSGFRRDVGTDGGVGTVQALWARDVGDPVDENVYGSHPIYMEHRATKHSSKTHGVFLMSAAGGDVILLTPPESEVSLVEYRMIGGVLDFYFLSGPSPIQVIEQYAEIVGLPTWQPYWGFGFHLCRWGYLNINETREQVTKMREANIPLEVMWNDIDLYHAVRDYTTDPVSYPAEEVRQFIHELHDNNQHYIPIVDAAVPKQVNDTDIYDPYTAGVERKVFMTNPDGSEYVGQVWPGYTVFPDWFAEKTADWWTEALANWSTLGVEYDGIWLDMNEVSSFCDGSCGSGIDISNTTAPFLLPGQPGNLVTSWPECYDGTVSGPSGNITVNGKLTCDVTALEAKPGLLRRGIGAGNQTDIDINSPPYAIHNGFGPLWVHTVATNATHAGGYAELDTHSLWGLMEEHVTHNALTKIRKGTRPFIISRSTFPSSGKWTGHWLGDNESKWRWMYLSIQGVLQFQLFQIPMVGADTCGFGGNTNEELCNRWMQLSAFTPFYRNHNTLGAISQEPYRWDSVAEASRTAIAVRYAMLPYWYTLFADASRYGTPPVRALWYEFPTESELFGVDRQFLIGSDILVTPVFEPSATTVDGIFPGVASGTVWYDWYTHKAVKAAAHRNTTLEAPLGHINVHVRSGAVLLLHSRPAYTIAETREGPFELLITLDGHGKASGKAYLDDGVSYPPGPSRELAFSVAGGGKKLHITSKGSWTVHQTLEKVTVLGVKTRPHRITADGHALHDESWTFDAEVGRLEVGSLAIDLNKEFELALL